MRLRHRLILCSAGILGVLLLSSALLQAAGSAPMPEATGRAVAEFITKTSPYEKWSLVPGTTRFRDGKSPHGTFQNVYANDIAMKAFAEGTLPMPDGSIIVKDNFNADKQRVGLTIMYKKAGFNPAGNDYFWLRLDAEKKPAQEGKLASCAGCHARAAATDLIVLYPTR